jgi:hypothetical protein
MASFQVYNPLLGQQKPSLRACEVCYTRKVRCDTGGRATSCSYCITHGTECKARSRKRKASSITSQPLSFCTADANRRHAELEGQSSAAANGEDFDSVRTAPFFFLTYNSSPAPNSSPDAFYNSAYLSRSAILGDDFPGLDHSHANGTTQEHSLTPSDLEVLKIYDAFHLPDLPIRQSLLEAFVEYAWTWMPVLDLSVLGRTGAAEGSSLLLLQAVLLVGMLMRPEVFDNKMVFEQYKRVKALINTGYERNPINILAALCLVQWYTSTAPNDLSTDTPRFWANYAAGLAQQIGLHRPSLSHQEDFRLRRRIWWTLCTRDNLMASAHGRPRMLNPADSTILTIDIDDFEDRNDRRAAVFVAYVVFVQILGDLCEILRRYGCIGQIERARVISRLGEGLSKLSEPLNLLVSGTSSQAYDLEIAQLHIPIMIVVTILHRPSSIFSLGIANAESITAAHLAFRLFEAIHLRGHTRVLSSAFAWHLLAASIPHLSALRLPMLKRESSEALDVLERSLSTLGTVRPAAANNLRNVRAIRDAVNASSRVHPTAKNDPEPIYSAEVGVSSSCAHLFHYYGPLAVQYHHRIVSLLKESSNSHSGKGATAEDATAKESNTAQSCSQLQEHAVDLLPDIAVSGSIDGAQDLFTGLFGAGVQDKSWMRDWMEDLQMPPE